MGDAGLFGDAVEGIRPGPSGAYLLGVHLWWLVVYPGLSAAYPPN